MQSRWMAVCVCLVSSVMALADEVVKAPVQSAGLFKNGLALVRRTTVLKGPGVFRVEDLPTPVHGTFWIESPVPVTATAGMRLVEMPAADGPVDLQDDLAGRSVDVYLHDSDRAISGRVVEVTEATGSKAWNRRYERPQYYSSYMYSGMTSPARYLIVDKGDRSREYIDISQIARVSVNSNEKTIKRKQPVLMLQVSDPGPETPNRPAEIPVTISYLSKGLSWAPSYRVDLKDDKHLTIEQQAVVRNELAELKDAELLLISGFPSMQFGHVLSPLSPETNWASFFQQLNQQFGSMASAMSNMTQQVAIRPDDSGGLDLPAAPNGEGVDLHYQPIGRRTLDEGDAMSLSVSSAEAEYERIMEWVVRDNRDAAGRYTQDRSQDAEKLQDTVWDSVRFKNPFAFPMTTAPAMILQKGRFAGQQQSYWVNAGEETTLRITKALAVRVRSVEQEVPGQREIVFVGGNDYRKVGVKGELSIRNGRNEDATMIVRRQFAGDLTRADREPKLELREEGIYSVNRRNELTWTLPLKAGESVTLSYEYTVLVDN